MVKAIFSSSSKVKTITSFSIGSIIVDYYALTNPFKHGFKMYTKVCIASAFASLGNATTTLLNAVLYSYTEPVAAAYVVYPWQCSCHPTGCIDL